MVRLVDWVSYQFVRSLGFSSRWVDTSKGPIHVLEREGTGPLPPLVLQHGLSSRGTHFRALIPRLTKHFSRILIPDLLGHGYSHLPEQGLWGPDVTDSLSEALSRVVGDRPAMVFGTSMGGYGLIHFASRHPAQVRGMMLVSPAGAVMPQDEFQAMLSRFTVRNRDDARVFMGRVFAGKMPLEPIVASIIEGQLNQPHIHGFIEAMGEHDYIRPPVLEKLTMPTRMYWGLDEKLFTDSDLQYYSRHIPDVQVLRPEGWGHSPFSERPAEVAEHILDFAQELDSR